MLVFAIGLSPEKGLSPDRLPEHPGQITVDHRLTDQAHVVATVTRSEDLDFLRSGNSTPAGFLEFRLDNLLPHIAKAEETLRHSPRPVLLTVRRPDEGGAGALSDGERFALYSDYLSAAAMIDTELASLASPEFSGLAGLARETGRPLVGSFHDFNRWPGIEALREKVDQAGELGCDAVKLAVVVEKMADLFSLADLVERHRGNGGAISAMGMGPLGKLSRLVLAKAGSCLNYGYLQTPNAPGQWSAEELSNLIREI